MAGTISRPSKTLDYARHQEPPKNRRGWHLDKSINLPFLLSLALFVFAAFAYEMNKQEKQIATERDLKALNKEVQEFKTDTKADNREMNRKLDDILKEMRKR